MLKQNTSSFFYIALIIISKLEFVQKNQYLQKSIAVTYSDVFLDSYLPNQIFPYFKEIIYN